MTTPMTTPTIPTCRWCASRGRRRLRATGILLGRLIGLYLAVFLLLIAFTSLMWIGGVALVALAALAIGAGGDAAFRSFGRSWKGARQ